jgi:hypothetical protein
MVQDFEGQSPEMLSFDRRVDLFDFVHDRLDDAIAGNFEGHGIAVVRREQLAEIQQGIDQAAAEGCIQGPRDSLGCDEGAASRQHRCDGHIKPYTWTQTRRLGQGGTRAREASQRNCQDEADGWAHGTPASFRQGSSGPKRPAAG